VRPIGDWCAAPASFTPLGVGPGASDASKAEPSEVGAVSSSRVSAWVALHRRRGIAGERGTSRRPIGTEIDNQELEIVNAVRRPAGARRRLVAWEGQDRRRPSPGGLWQTDTDFRHYERRG